MHAPIRPNLVATDLFDLRLNLRVGITGHRPPRLQAEHIPKVQEDLATVLSVLRDALDTIHAENDGLFSHLRGRLVLVSPLADGADQIAAESALKAGETVDVCLPFSPATYREDFDEEATRRFDELLGAARAVLVLPGTQLDRTAAYQAVGDVTAAQSDILLAVWDGQPAQGLGGTPEMISDAVANQLPVVVIDANGEKSPQLLWNIGDDALHDSPSLHTVGVHEAAEILPNLVRELVAPPPASRELLQDLREASARSWLRPIGYPLLLVATAVRSWKQAFRPSSLNDSADQLRPLLGAFDEIDVVAQHNSEKLLHRFAAADVAASTFANRYRGGYVTSFALAALAVGLALAGLLAPEVKMGFVIAELVTIAIIMLRTRAANAAQWHRRWLDARHLAELLRLLPMAASLGDLSILRRMDTGPRAPFSWYAQTTAREVSICDGVMDHSRVSKVQKQALSLVEDQIRYHRMNTQRMRAIDQRLRQAGETLFLFTILTSLAWLAAKAVGAENSLVLGMDATMLAVFLAALLPALGGAIYGIRKQGDFSGSAERSRVSASQLTKLRLAIQRDSPDYRRLTRRVRRLGEIMLSEVEQWRLVCAIRPIELPS